MQVQVFGVLQVTFLFFSEEVEDLNSLKSLDAREGSGRDLAGFGDDEDLREGSGA